MTPDEIDFYLHKYDAMICGIAHRWFKTNRDVEFDELRNAAVVGVYEAAKHFDKTKVSEVTGKTMQFSTLMTFHCNNQCRRAIREARGYRASGDLDETQRIILSLNSGSDDGDGGPINSVPDREQDERPDMPERFWERVESCVGWRYAVIMRQRLCDGLTLREIADMHEVTRERVRQIVEKGIVKLRNSGMFKEEWLAA